MASLRVWTGFRPSRLLGCGSDFALVLACWRLALGSTIHRKMVQLRHLYPFISASSFLSVVVSRVIGCPGTGSCVTAPRQHGFLTCLAAHSGAVAPPLISFWCLIGYFVVSRLWWWLCVSWAAWAYELWLGDWVGVLLCPCLALKS
jgi:hypothetical protein